MFNRHLCIDPNASVTAEWSRISIFSPPLEMQKKTKNLKEKLHAMIWRENK